MSPSPMSRPMRTLPPLDPHYPFVENATINAAASATPSRSSSSSHSSASSVMTSSTPLLKPDGSPSVSVGEQQSQLRVVISAEQLEQIEHFAYAVREFENLAKAYVPDVATATPVADASAPPTPNALLDSWLRQCDALEQLFQQEVSLCLCAILDT